MEQHYARSRRITPVEIVESHAVALDKATNGGFLRSARSENTMFPTTRTMRTTTTMMKTVSAVDIARPHDVGAVKLTGPDCRTLKEPVCATTGT